MATRPVSAKLCVSVIIFMVVIVELTDTLDVTTKYGTVRGRNLVVNGRSVNQFGGIPYARPPVGRLRFAKPVEPLSWSPKVLDTTNYQPVYCFENNSLKLLSEDCLYLTIWTPVRNESQQLLPVYFFIYGGFFNSMGGYYDDYNASYIVRDDVINVFAIFRANVFGFFHGNRPDAPGNLGIWDQAMAIKWTAENIQAFGGDPDRLTLAGVSSGGAAVFIHSVSPVSQRYLSRIMLMSAPLPGYKRKSLIDHSKKMAAMLNCTKSNYVACMRRLKPEPISEAWTKFNALSFGPYVGDDLFPRPIMPALREGRFNKSVPLLSGGHPMEYITSYDSSCVRIFGYNETQNYTLTSDDVKNCFTETFPNDTRLVDGAVKHYLKGLDESDSRALQRVTALALGHYLFTCPTYFASSIIARQRDSSDVFSYYLPYGTQQTTVYCTNRTWARPCHGEERYGSFGTAFREPQVYNDTDRTYTTQMIRLWSTFAATGKPPTMGGYRWPAYQDPPLAPLAPSNMGTSDRPIWPSYMVVTPLGPQVAPLYKQYTDCDKFWSKHIGIYNQSSIPTS